MALNGSSLRGWALFVRGKVKLDSATSNYFFFTVDDISVTFDRRKDLWTCTCEHEAWRGSKIHQECYHIKGAKFYVQEFINKKED